MADITLHSDADLTQTAVGFCEGSCGHRLVRRQTALSACRSGFLAPMRTMFWMTDIRGEPAGPGGNLGTTPPSPNLEIRNVYRPARNANRGKSRSAVRIFPTKCAELPDCQVAGPDQILMHEIDSER